MEMEKILLVISNTVSTLGDLRDSILEENKKIAEIKQQLDLSKIERDTRVAELDAREAEIRKVEDVIELKEETQKLIARQEEAAEALTKKERAFNSLVEKTKKELSEQETKNKQAFLNNENETKALIKAREDLEVEKMEYKFKFMQRVVQGADKK